jgi:hypothetical protein
MLPKLAYLTLYRTIQLLVLLPAARPPRTWRSSSSASSSRSCAARPHDHGSNPPTAPSLPPSAACCPAPAGRASWCSPRRYCAGTEGSSPAPGPIPTADLADRSSTKTSSSSSSAWPTRTQAGATSVSKASYGASGCRSRRPGSASRSAAMGLTRHHDEEPQRGKRSCASRPPESSRATTSPSTRCGSSGCTCCSSSNLRRDASTWPG